MLSNLARIYRMNADPGNLEWVMRMRLVIPGVPPSEALQLAQQYPARQ